MLKIFMIIMTSAFSLTVHAGEGGAIGGGDVTFRAILECDAHGIDPTFDSARYVALAEEVDENGSRVANTYLKVITLDAARRPLNYYVTHLSNLFSLQQVNISIWQYELGSTGNQQIGFFRWSEAQQAGAFSVEDLQLTNCK